MTYIVFRCVALLHFCFIRFVLFCIALRLLRLACRKGKLSHVTVCFVWFCFTLFVGRELSHVSICFALFVGEGNCHTLRFALFCFVLACLFCSCEGKLSHVTISFPFLCFVSLCIALHKLRYAKNKPKAF